MRTSTSAHRISADGGVPAGRGASWLILNQLRNLWRPGASPPFLVRGTFVPSLTDLRWADAERLTSPARRLGDLFWAQLPWMEIERELGAVNVFDTGCGSGVYAGLLREYSHGIVRSYVGTDVAESADSWSALSSKYPRTSFFCARASEVGDRIPTDTTLLISFSAIEHFEDDLLYFHELSRFV